MRISLKQIRDFSQCPRLYYFRRDQPRKPLSIEATFAREVIKRCYLNSTETGFKVNWRRIVGWVDKLVFRHNDPKEEESFRRGKRQAEVVLKFIQTWYDSIYIPLQQIGYIDLAIGAQVSNSTVTGHLDLVTLPGPSLLFIEDVALTNPRLYNDIYYRGLAWLLEQELGCEVTSLEHFSIGKEGGTSRANAAVDARASQRIGRAVNEIVRQMEQKVSYPSISSHCLECPFKRSCRL